MKLSINFLCREFLILFQFIMQIDFLLLDEKVLLSLLLEGLSFFQEILFLLLKFANSLLIIGNFAKQLSIDLFLVQELENKLLGIRNSSGNLNVLEGHLND